MASTDSSVPNRTTGTYHAAWRASRGWRRISALPIDSAPSAEPPRPRAIPARPSTRFTGSSRDAVGVLLLVLLVVLHEDAVALETVTFQAAFDDGGGALLEQVGGFGALVVHGHGGAVERHREVDRALAAPDAAVVHRALDAEAAVVGPAPVAHAHLVGVAEEQRRLRESLEHDEGRGRQQHGEHDAHPGGPPRLGGADTRSEIERSGVGGVGKLVARASRPAHVQGFSASGTWRPSARPRTITNAVYAARATNTTTHPSKIAAQLSTTALLRRGERRWLRRGDGDRRSPRASPPGCDG